MEVRIKKLSENAVIPQYAKIGDAGLDLVATSIDRGKIGRVIYGTDLAVEIPEGHVGLLFPRSSIHKTELILANSVGIIDSGYRGEVKVVFKMVSGNYDEIYKVGDRVAQLIIMPYPYVEFVETDILSDTDRADGGFGSTGD